MAFFATEEMPWHEGEEKMHELLHVPYQEKPDSPFLTPGAGYMLQRAPLLALGALDKENRPWTTVWGGEPGFAKPVAESIIGIRALVDKKNDPLAHILFGGRDDGEVVHEKEGKGRIVSALTIDLETRKRVKLAGRMVAGALGSVGEEGDEQAVSIGQVQLVVKIDQSLGNCPKYLNRKHIVPSLPEPKLISDSPQLPSEALSLLEKADLFFISSSHHMEDMDTNHRGGPPGFVRVVSNDPSGALLAYPEYSGNRLYQTLGNLQSTPLAGLAIPDFDTGDILYLTCSTEILVGKTAAALLPRSNLAVKLTTIAAKFVVKGLSFKGILGERSPYNPSVRYTTNEKLTPGTTTVTEVINHAKLVQSTKLTPSITRFRFRIEDPFASGTWKPGQYATLSFADDMDMGYSHMRDDDPKSLNDDYLRTFTVSSPPSKSFMENDTPDKEFDLTIRRVGRVTDHLFKQNVRGGYQVSLKGFEGEFRFEHKPAGGIIPFIAGAIGITPVLGQLSSMDVSQLRLLWTVNVVDIGLVADIFKTYPDLPEVTTLFLTGDDADLNEEETNQLRDVQASAAKIERRRIREEDIKKVDEMDGVDEWYICVGPALKTNVLAWLAGKRVAYEDFNY